MTRRGTIFAAAVGLGFAVLAGCSDDDTVAQEPGAAPSATASGVSGQVLPSQLVGTWEVEGAGVEPGTVLLVTASEARVFIECGLIDGSWDGLVGGAFLADTYSASGECKPKGNTFTPDWLDRGSAFAVEGEGRELRDGDGKVVASLQPATERPNVPSTVIDSYGDPPVLTEEQRADLDRLPPDFPDGIRPAERSELIGTWVLPGETGDGDNWPYATFRKDGRWIGSDGCNGLGGKWASVDGALLQGGGVHTDIGCENIDLVSGAALAGFDGDTLVLFNEDGQETHRVVPGPAPKRS